MTEGLRRERLQRIASPLVDGRPVRWDASLDCFADRIRQVLDTRGGEGVALLAGPDCTNEEYAMLHRFSQVAVKGASISVVGVDAFAPFREALSRRWGSWKGYFALGQLAEADVAFLLEAECEGAGMGEPLSVPSGANVIRMGEDRAPSEGDAVTISLRPATLETGIELLGRALRGESFGGSDMGISAEEFSRAASCLRAARHPVALIGPKAAASRSLCEALLSLWESLPGRALIPLYPANAVGAVLLGLPNLTVADLVAKGKKGALQALFAVGVDPQMAGFSDGELETLPCLGVALARVERATWPGCWFPISEGEERAASYFALDGERFEVPRSILAPPMTSDFVWVAASLARRLGVSLAAPTRLVLAGG